MAGGDVCYALGKKMGSREGHLRGGALAGTLSIVVKWYRFATLSP